jgi:alpha-tubulin suppressor-like RCC1 family protein
MLRTQRWTRLFSTEVRKKMYTWGTTMTHLGYKTSLATNGGNHPRALDVDLDITKVAMSRYHAAFVTSEGDVYTFGRGDYGMLGHGNDKPQETPKRVSAFSDSGFKVVDVSLGEYHSVFLTDDGDVWTCGYGGEGDVKLFGNFSSRVGGGLGQPGFCLLTPRPIQSLKERDHITQICAGMHQCMAVGSKERYRKWEDVRMGEKQVRVLRTGPVNGTPGTSRTPAFRSSQRKGKR